MTTDRTDVQAADVPVINAKALDYPPAAALYGVTQQLATLGRVTPVPMATVSALIEAGNRVIAETRPSDRVSWAAFSLASADFMEVAGRWRPERAVSAVKVRAELARQRVTVRRVRE
jgi:hypothetical protein